MTVIAKYPTHCRANCGRLIHPGDAMSIVDDVHLHADCIVRYEKQLEEAEQAERGRPPRPKPRTQNQPQRSAADDPIIGHQCEHCGQHYAGRASTVPDPPVCRAKSYTLPRGIVALSGERCGGLLVRVS